jgi:rhodanese-related sulfurtransferase
MKHSLLLLIISLVFASCMSSVDTSTNLQPETFKSRIEGNAVQLVDVRTPKEFNSGHIKNAININYLSKHFKDSIRLLQTKIPTYIYCRSGKRSSKSMSKFKTAGFDSIYQLKGGFLAWKSLGFTIGKE